MLLLIFFANISFLSGSQGFPQLKFSPSDCTEVFITDYELEPCLNQIKPTAPELDALASWIFSKVITPVPKLPKPVCLADFRSISVTPILSRLAEKLIVQEWLLPAIIHQTVDDQFAIRPTGSTTCALVFFMHHVTRLLETNSYVRCLLVDISKAFDVVDHGILASKLTGLNMPPTIFSLSLLAGG